MDRRLETFLAVCQTMNYRRAAEALHLTQRAMPTTRAGSGCCRRRCCAHWRGITA